MLRRFIAMFAMLVLVSCGSLTAPDGDDVGRVTAKIAAMPPQMLHAMKLWAANRFTSGYLKGKSNNTMWLKIGTIDCPGGGSKDVTVGDMLECLRADQMLTYKECLTIILDDIINGEMGAAAGADGYACRWRGQFTPGYDPAHLPDECDPEHVDARMIFDQLASSPAPPSGLDPAMLMQFMTIVGPELCFLSGGWSCPEDPAYPGVTQQPPQGDR